MRYIPRSKFKKKLELYLGKYDRFVGIASIPYCPIHTVIYNSETVFLTPLHLYNVWIVEEE